MFTGRRLIRSMGRLKGVEVDESFIDEPLQVEDLPYVRMIFRHMGGGYSLDQRIFVDGKNKV